LYVLIYLYLIQIFIVEHSVVKYFVWNLYVIVLINLRCLIPNNAWLPLREVLVLLWKSLSIKYIFTQLYVTFIDISFLLLDLVFQILVISQLWFETLNFSHWKCSNMVTNMIYDIYSFVNGNLQNNMLQTNFHSFSLYYQRIFYFNIWFIMIWFIS